MKIGFIGLGNMGGAIIGGIIKSGLFAPEDILGFDISSSEQRLDMLFSSFFLEMH